MYPCPHCGKPGISPFRKSCLGPALPATCQSCGGKVGVPYGASMLVLIPFLVAITVAHGIESLPWKVLVWAGGFAVYMVLHVLWVPLERR